MTTSIVIPVYHPTEAHLSLTKACLESLRYGMPDEVIVVDDGSPIQLQDYPSYVRLISREKNGGYVKTVTAGIEASTGDIIIVGNNDLVFMPGWIEAIVNPIKNGYDISSIRTTEPDGWDTEEKITDNEKFGNIFAITRDAYRKLEGFDQRFTHYFGDTDLRRRAINMGLKIGKNHAGLVEHVGNATYAEVDPEHLTYTPDMRAFAEKWGFLD